MKTFSAMKLLFAFFVLIGTSNALTSLGGQEISDGVLYAFLSGILIGVWRTATIAANALRDMKDGRKRMEEHEFRLDDHSTRLHDLDKRQEAIYEGRYK